MKASKASLRKLAEYKSSARSFVMERVDATYLMRVIKELLDLLQAEMDRDYELLDEEVEEIKEALGAWFMEDYPLYVGS